MDEYYKKRKGGAGVHGTDYQLEVLTFFFLRAYETGRKFKLSTENFDDGKLDDAVLNDGNEIILAQTKHNESANTTIHLEALFSDESPFSVMVCLKSFEIKYLSHLKKLQANIEKTESIEMKHTSREAMEAFEKGSDRHPELFRRLIQQVKVMKNKSLLEQIEWFEKSSMYLITNLKLHRYVQIGIETKFNENDFFHVGGDEVYYKFNHEDIVRKHEDLKATGIPPITNTPTFFIKYFFEKFRMVNLTDLVLKRNIKSTLLNIHFFTKLRRNFDIVYNFIREEIKNWYLFYRHETDGYFLKRMHFEVFFSDFSTNMFIIELRKFEDKFHFEIDELITKINNNSVSLIKTSRYLLLLVKLQEKWLKQIEERQILFLNPDEDIDIQFCLLKSFIYHKYTHIICSITEKNRDLVNLINDTISALGGRNYKKFILLSEYELDLKHPSITTSIKDDEYFRKLTLSGIRRSKSLGDIEKYYVTRTIKWKYDYVLEDPFLSKLLKSDDKFVLIIDGPGMGKTTLLNSLTCKMNEMENIWAIKIELNAFTRLLKDKFNQKEDLQVKDFLIFSSNKTIQDRIESQLFTIPHVIYLFIDAVDEVSPKYTDLVLNLLHHTKDKVAKIIVASREPLKTKLADSLDVVPCTLDLFSPKEQKNFIISHWVHKLELEDSEMLDKCEEFCKNLLKHLELSLAKIFWNFIGMPLQTRMVAEIFLKGSSSCQQFLDDQQANNMKFPNYLTLGELYDKFIERKKEIYVEEKCNTQGNDAAEAGLKKEFNEYMRTCQKIAVTVFFDMKYWKHFDQNNDPVKIDDDNLYKIGLLVLSEGNRHLLSGNSSSEESSSENSSAISNTTGPQFIHRSFAEYFLAKTISQKLLAFKFVTHSFFWTMVSRWPGRKETFKKTDLVLPSFLLNKVFLKPHFIVVQQFIDCDLQTNWKCISNRLLALFATALLKTNINNERNLLHLARRGCLHILKLVLDGSRTPKTWINQNFGEGNSNILHESMKYLPVVKLLVAHGADLKLKGIFNKTALHYAVENGYYDVVKYLVEQGNEVDVETQAGLTPLHEAIFNGHIQTAIYLIENGACVSKRTGGGWTSLHYATLFSHLTLIEIILRKGENINEKTIKNFPGRTALHIAFEKQDFIICRNLLQKGIDINLKDERGWGLWSYAVDNETCNNFLIEQSEHYVIEKDSEALGVAVSTGKEKPVEFLIGQGFNVNNKNRKGWTPLQEAVRKGHLHIVKILLNCGADEKVTTEDEKNIMHLAAETGDLKLFLYLEKLHPNIKSKTTEGLTTLHFAAAQGEPDLVEYICGKSDKAFISEMTIHGRTTLHQAALCGQKDVVKFFVDKFGLALDARANNGETVLHVAVAQGSIEVIEYIIDTLKRKSIDLNFTSKTGSYILYKPNSKNEGQIEKCLLDAGVKNELIVTLKSAS